MKTNRFLGIILAAIVIAPLLAGAQTPQYISFQGRLTSLGADFTGVGQFKFALVNGNGAVTFWSNDGSSLAGSQPALAVSVGATQGLFSVLLGDTSVASMTPISPVVFTNSDVRLRIWFSDGTNGFQLLAP